MSADETKPTTKPARAASTAAKPRSAGKAPAKRSTAATPSSATKPSTTRSRTTSSKGDEAVAGQPAATNGSRRYTAPEVSGLRRRYRDEVAPALQREFGYANPMQIPRVSRVVVNIGLGEAIANAKALDAAVGDMAIITGQKPIVTRARRSIAQFRLRTGMPIGVKVTLRGQRMYDFLERTMALALPRIRDFRGIPTRSFDGRGNFSLGLREQLVYPEIDYDKIDRLRGLEISIVTTAKTDEEGHKLLELLGMPFQST